MLADFEINLIKIDKVSRPDGEGGIINGYQEGAEFKGVLNIDSSTEAKIAEKQGVASFYTLMVNENIALEYGDVFKRKSDGQTFKITSNKGDGLPPSMSSIRMITYQAELHRLK